MAADPLDSSKKRAACVWETGSWPLSVSRTAAAAVVPLSRVPKPAAVLNVPTYLPVGTVALDETTSLFVYPATLPKLRGQTSELSA